MKTRYFKAYIEGPGGRGYYSGLTGDFFCYGRVHGLFLTAAETAVVRFSFLGVEIEKWA